MKNNKFGKLIMFLSCLFLCFLFENKNVYAGITDNAKEFYDRYHSKMQLIDGDIYFASEGKMAGNNAGTKYETIAFNVTFDIDNGESKGVIKAGTDYKSVSSVTSGEYIYNMWKISYERLVDRVKPEMKNELLNREITSQIRFKSICVIYENRSYPRGQDWHYRGGITENYEFWGEVYDNHYDLAYRATAFYTGPDKEYKYIPWSREVIGSMKSLFNMRCYLPADQKPKPPTYENTIVYDSPYSTTEPCLGKKDDLIRTYWFKNNTVFKYDHIVQGNNSNLWKVNTAIKEANTWAYWFNGGDESKKGTYIDKNVDGTGLISYQPVCIDGNERRKITRYSHMANKDIDIALCADGINVFGQWMVGLDGKEKSEAVDGGYRIKTDGGRPKYKFIDIKSKDSKGMIILVSGVYDTRSGIGKIKFPTWSGETQEELTDPWPTFDLNNSDEIQGNIKKVRTYKEDGYVKYDFEYEISYSDWKYPDNIQCHVYIDDNVGNYIGYGDLDLRRNPDLTVTSIKIYNEDRVEVQSLLTDLKYKLKVTVKNIGDYKAESSNLKISDESGLDKIVRIGSLGINESESFTVEYSKKSEGKVKITALADANDEIKEEKEDNNSLDKEYSIKQLLTVSGEIIPEVAKKGQQVLIKVNTFGYANKINIEFPRELQELESPQSLRISKDITVEKRHSEYIYVYLPEKTMSTLKDSNKRIKPPYEIEVKASNIYGREVQCILKLDVVDSILKGLKPSIGRTIYDIHD